jgi:cysteinyl-tRNA synthetase
MAKAFSSSGCVLSLLLFMAPDIVSATGETAAVAAITANGCTTEVIAPAQRAPSLRVFLSAETEVATQSDWWLVARAPQGWFYYSHPTGWSAAQGLEGIQPAYQGPLADLPGFDIPDMVLPGVDFSAGNYTFYFGVDRVRNGQLDLGSATYAQMLVRIVEGTSGDACSRLSNADRWMYQIQDLDADAAVETLDDTDYPLLVVEPGHNFIDFSYDTAGMIDALRQDVNGGDRVLLAYIDVGQAEDYRDYWGDDWVAPTETERGWPEFLMTIDPDGWSGNYVVAYWHEDWKNLWLGDDGIIAELARFGFDGVYLDWVEAHDDDAVRALADQEGVDPESEMIRFIEEIGSAGRAVSPDFLVVAQNAPYLVDADPDRYVRSIDALAVEDTWFHGDGDVDWDDPRAGDLRERYDEPGWTTQDRLEQYERYTKRGLRVFSVDYCVSTQNAAFVYAQAREEGLVPLVTRVPLSRMTGTPPELFP